MNNVVDLTDELIWQAIEDEFLETGAVTFVRARCPECSTEVECPMAEVVIKAERGQMFQCVICNPNPDRLPGPKGSFSGADLRDLRNGARANGV